MNRYWWILCLTAALSISCGNTTSNKPPHPNIVVILADDMGYGDPGAYNSSSQISTPNNDQLAKAKETDSQSILPVLLGKKDSVRSSLVIEDRAIRKGPWKLIFGYGIGECIAIIVPIQTVACKR